MGAGHLGRGLPPALRPVREGDNEQDVAEQPEVPPAVQRERAADPSEGHAGHRRQELEVADQERGGRHDRAVPAREAGPQDRPAGHDPRAQLHARHERQRGLRAPAQQKRLLHHAHHLPVQDQRQLHTQRHRLIRLHPNPAEVTPINYNYILIFHYQPDLNSRIAICPM